MGGTSAEKVSFCCDSGEKRMRQVVFLRIGFIVWHLLVQLSPLVELRQVKEYCFLIETSKICDNSCVTILIHLF